VVKAVVVLSLVKVSGATRKRPTPFAADTFAALSAGSGYAAEGTRREPVELSLGEGVLPVPPLPLKPTVGRNS
jgi:hypothetical protein